MMVAAPIVAQAQDTPLVMGGKTSLFERVLVRDATSRFSAPGGDLGAAVRSVRFLSSVGF